MLKFILTILFIFPVLITASCSPTTAKKRYTSSATNLAQMSGLDLYRSSNADAVLSDISSRLQTGLKKASTSTPETPEIFLVRSPQCLALNQSGVLLVSDHLVYKLDHVAELAFILAHETAHVILGHEAGTKQTARQHELEMEADYVGIKLLALAGYNPWYAIDALIKAYSCNYWADTSSHPSLQARADALAKNLASLGFGSSSRSGNRDFIKLKHEIAQSYSQDLR